MKGEGIFHILIREHREKGPSWPESVAAGLGLWGADQKQRGTQEGPRSPSAQWVLSERRTG